MLSGLFIGIAFGFLLQRSQFRFRFPESLFSKKLAIFDRTFHRSIRSVRRIFRFIRFRFNHDSHDSAAGFGYAGGGLLFGAGMVLANCCAAGAWFRTGEGLTGSWIALVCFSLTMAATQTGALRSWINPIVKQVTPIDNIYLTFGISPWILTALLVVATVALTVYQIRHPRYQPPRKPTTPLIAHPLFANPWNLFVSAALIGVLGIAAWVLSEQTGRSYGFGIAVPSANAVQYLVNGQHRYLNWGTYFVLGMMLGSFISAKLSGEFEISLPEPKAVLQRMSGGVMMGIGAALAGGCTVTNSLVSTAYFSWQGWLSTLMIMIGCWLMSAIIKPTQCRI